MAGKTWKKTRVQFLWQNIDHGTYYARLFRDGKEHWKSLRTDVYSVAVAKLAVFLQDFRSNAPAAKTVERGKATVENLSELYLEQVGKDQSIKPATVHYRKQIGHFDPEDLAGIAGDPTQECDRSGLHRIGGRVRQTIFPHPIQQRSRHTSPDIRGRD